MRVLSKICSKDENYSVAKEIFSVTYCQTPEEVFLTLGLEKLE